MTPRVRKCWVPRYWLFVLTTVFGVQCSIGHEVNTGVNTGINYFNPPHRSRVEVLGLVFIKLATNKSTFWAFDLLIRNPTLHVVVNEIKYAKHRKKRGKLRREKFINNNSYLRLNWSIFQEIFFIYIFYTYNCHISYLVTSNSVIISCKNDQT